MRESRERLKLLIEREFRFVGVEVLEDVDPHEQPVAFRCGGHLWEADFTGWHYTCSTAGRFDALDRQFGGNPVDELDDLIGSLRECEAF